MPHPARLPSILWTNLNMLETPGFAFTIVAFLAVLGPLVFVHEYGHYIVGRWCGVKADTFSIGFGRKILGWTDKRGTEWKIGWLPLGGYVQFAGDMNPASQPSPEWLALPAEERNRTFQAKALWQRSLIVLAGPVTNLLLAVVILAGFTLANGKAWRAPQVIAGINLTTPGSASINNLFGEIPLNSAISGRVWEDTDNDGVIDPSEQGIGNVVVRLTGTELDG